LEIILDDRGTCNLSVVNLMGFVDEDGTTTRKIYLGHKD
jgi:hypothetical protein